MINIKNTLISITILAVASLSLISDDFLKFLLSGRSNTYDASLIRHSPITVFLMSFVVIFFVFLLKRKHIYKYLLGISLVFWMLSLSTFIVVKNHNTILISGFSLFPISSCEVFPKDKRTMKFYFFLGKEVEKAIDNHSPD
jgi:uncharacterized membrane protein